MRRRSFLGLPYTSLVAHARHIQRSPSFHDLSYRTPGIPFYPGEALGEKELPVQNNASSTGQPVQSWENEGGAGAASSPPR